MAKGLPVLSNTGRKVIATKRPGGMLSKGTAYDRSGSTYAQLPGFDWHGTAVRLHPGQNVLDKLAEKAMSGGYTARNRKCPTCGVLRSNIGGCFC